MGIAVRAAGLYISDELTRKDFQGGATALLPDPRVGILVFPEGSRSRDGAVQRFRPGAFVLAKKPQRSGGASRDRRIAPGYLSRIDVDSSDARA